MSSEAIKCLWSLIWSVNQTSTAAHHPGRCLTGDRICRERDYFSLDLSIYLEIHGWTVGTQVFSSVAAIAAYFSSCCVASISSEKRGYFARHSNSAAVQATLCRSPGEPQQSHGLIFTIGFPADELLLARGMRSLLFCGGSCIIPLLHFGNAAELWCEIPTALCYC